MPGYVNVEDKFSIGDQFQLEMDNVAAKRDLFDSVRRQEFLHIDQSKLPYIQTGDNSQRGSILSLKDRSDMQMLTESHPCIHEECMKFHSPRRSNDSGSPGSPLKNFIFYLVLILLVTWVLVYSLLSKMNYL